MKTGADETVGYYDSIVQGYFEEWKDNRLLVPLLEVLVGRLPSMPGILDLGCGTGCESRRLVELGAAVTGVDLSTASLEIARRHAPGTSFQEMDVRDLDFPARSFDAVLDASLLFHFDDAEQRRILSSLRRLLRPRGLLLSVYLTGEYQGIQERSIGGKLVRRDVNQKSIGAWARFVCSAGFSQAMPTRAVLGAFQAALFARANHAEPSRG